MPKNFREIRRILINNGFVEVKGRGKGGHVMFYNSVTKKKTLVPCHSGDIGIGLEKEIWKQAGIKEQ